MKLRAECRRYHRLARRAFANANQSWADRSGCLLTLEDSDGGYGQGEAAPLPGYSDDDLTSAERELSELDLTALERVVQGAVAEPESLVTSLTQLRSPRGPAARFAVETALCDLIARRHEEPVHLFLRRCGVGGSAPLAPLRLAALLDVGVSVEQAELALGEGFTTLKVKVGAPGAAQRELEQLRTLRSHCGAEFALRLDANRALSATEARTLLNNVAPLGIEFVEEPCTDLGELGAVQVALALDESLRSLRDHSSEPLRHSSVTTWVVKPSVLGGISGALRVSERARGLGLDVVVSHVFEGPVAFAALGELALALGAAPRAQGLAAYPLLAAWNIAADSTPSPVLAPHRRPGLGIQRIKEPRA